MMNRLRLFVGVVVALALLVPVAGQQPAPATGQQAAAAAFPQPTKKDPLRYRTVLQTQGQDAGAMGVAEIELERWSTDEERQTLVSLLSGTTLKTGGQDKLLKALAKMKPRTGFMKLPNTLGWDLRYAYSKIQPDGTQQIVIATDKPVSAAASLSASEALDYPFTIIQMHMNANGKGDGRMLARSAVTVKNGRLELENYGDEPIKLSEITLQEKKK